MLKKFSVGSKVTLVLTTVAIITVVTVSLIAYNFSVDKIESEKFNSLQVIAELKKNKVENNLKFITSNARIMQEASDTKKALDYFSASNTNSTAEYYDTLNQLADGFLKLFRNNELIQEVYLTSLYGEIIYSSEPNNVNFKPGTVFNDSDGNIFSGAQQEEGYFSNVLRENEDIILFYSTKLSNSMGETIAYLILKISSDPFFKLATDTTGMGATGEVIFGRLFNNRVLYLNNLRFDSNAALRKSVYLGDISGNPLQQAVRGNSGSSLDVDYRNETVLATWDFIPKLNWGMVTKIDQNEVNQKARKLLYSYLIAGFIIILITVLIGTIFSRFLINPIISLKTTLEMLCKGILPDKVEKTSSDEIGDMAILLNHMVSGLRNTADFAQEIGQGHFNADFKPMSSNDTLGNALLQMRDSIMQAESRDKERNWIVTGVAEIGEILRRHDELEQLGDEILFFVLKKINAIQGAFYVVNEDEYEVPTIEMTSSYAYNKKKYLHAKFKFAEGLVGQAAVEQDTVIRTEIPPDYVTITSGILGDKRPSCILIVPLITDEKVYGVIEFAGFHKFSEREVKFLEEVSLIIARTIFNIKVNDRTRKLLAESQKMSNELQEQQEILRQNAEEMEATQEELKRTNTQLEDQIEEVNRTQKRMQILLENASEVIAIYEENREVRYISPSVEKILGYNSSDMIGEDDLIHVHEESIEDVKNMFNELIENPFKQVSMQYKYIRKDGEPIWVESTGTNLLMDKAIQGILFNTRDITERKRAEQEERMRSQMQALSENSPDLITRFNTKGEFFYINPVIELFTGNKPDHFLNKAIDKVDLPEPIIKEWVSILEKMKEKTSKMSFEMDFPAQDEERVVQVNAIPEFGENEQLESVLVVSHDITERKLIELEIQTKNKKITESINYARRIQGAILPDNKVIQKALQNSFILYKAKDVVSGDFPWYMQIGNKLFIAAVDCTGHGVPGALISLIGYFLLNDIVRSRKVYDPGKILDLLDEGVTKTLRQDEEDSKTKDGMDISLCKIDLDENEVIYAGAHRPLYYVDDGEMNEIKGNRFPIGGGIYKNQTNFDSTTLKIKRNLSIYFCSDGFPDQFGGPEHRKFGPKRLRTIISEIHELPMHEQYKIFDEKWENWKGETKQIDDMLLIGIKF